MRRLMTPDPGLIATRCCSWAMASAIWVAKKRPGPRW